MSHLRVLQIIGSNGKEELKVLPGEFISDRECAASIAEEGDYLFLEVHHITKDAEKEEQEDETPKASTKKKNNGKA